MIVGPATRPAGPSPAVGLLEIAVVTALCLSAAVAFALAAGQDANWDQSNYHIAGAYALLNGREGVDVAPSQMQTWFNPLPYVPAFLAIESLSPRVVTVLLALVDGLNGLLVYLLGRRLLAAYPTGWAMVLAALSTLLSMTSGIFVSEVGTTMVDAMLSLGVLASILLLLPVGRPPSTRVLAVAAACAGAAFGLKLTNAIYLPGLALAVLLAWRVLAMTPGRLAVMAMAGLAAFAVTGGWWAGHLWQIYGNPIFPLRNDIFASPYIAAEPMMDDRFLPSSLVDGMLYPLWIALGRHPTTEGPYRDARFLLLVVLGAIALWPRRRSPDQPGIPPPASGFLAVFAVVTWVLWLQIYGIGRYLVALELVTGPLALVALDRAMTTRPARAIAMATICIVLLATTEPPAWGRHRFDKDWFGLGPELAAVSPGTLFVIYGDEPVSWVMPLLPKAAGFVRIAGNIDIDPQYRLGRQVVDRLFDHQGPIRTLAAHPITPADRERLELYGLYADPADCIEAASHTDTMISCRARLDIGFQDQRGPIEDGSTS